MKKVILFGSLAIALMSCKKEQECECFTEHQIQEFQPPFYSNYIWIADYNEPLYNERCDLANTSAWVYVDNKRFRKNCNK